MPSAPGMHFRAQPCNPGPPMGSVDLREQPPSCPKCDKCCHREAVFLAPGRWVADAINLQEGGSVEGAAPCQVTLGGVSGTHLFRKPDSDQWA